MKTIKKELEWVQVKQSSFIHGLGNLILSTQLIT